MKAVDAVQKAWKEQPGIVVLGALVILAALAVGVHLREKSKPATPTPSPTMTPMVATTNPQKVGMFLSTDGSGNAGTWVAMTGTGTPFTGTVQPVGLAVSIDGSGNPGTWAAATSTTFTSGVGSSTSPGIVASAANVSLTTASGGAVVGYNAPAGGGYFRACGYYMVTAPNAAGGNSYIQVTYTSNGHAMPSFRLSNNLATTAVGDSLQTTGYNPCQVFWADAGTNMNIYLVTNGQTTGTPTFSMSGTIERLI